MKIIDEKRGYSKFFGFLLGLYRKSKTRIINFAKFARVPKLVEKISEDFYSMPLKTTGIVIATAIFTNTLLSVLLKRHIGLSGWIMRIMLLFASFVTIFYNANKNG